MWRTRLLVGCFKDQPTFPRFTPRQGRFRFCTADFSAFMFAAQKCISEGNVSKTYLSLRYREEQLVRINHYIPASNQPECVIRVLPKADSRDWEHFHLAVWMGTVSAGSCKCQHWVNQGRNLPFLTLKWFQCCWTAARLLKSSALLLFVFILCSSRSRL